MTASPASHLHRLMADYVDGDQRAFSQLHQSLAPVMRRRLGRLVNDAGALDDIVQSAFLRAHEARHRFDLANSEDGTVAAWYIAIARNTALDHLRRRSRRTRREARVGFGAHPDTWSPVGSAETPEDARVRAETRQERALWVRAALNALCPRDRDLVVAHKLWGRTLAELALAEGVPQVTMRVRAHRAYKRLSCALRNRPAGEIRARELPELFGGGASAHYDRGQWDAPFYSAASWPLSLSPSG